MSNSKTPVENVLEAYKTAIVAAKIVANAQQLTQAVAQVQKAAAEAEAKANENGEEKKDEKKSEQIETKKSENENEEKTKKKEEKSDEKTETETKVDKSSTELSPKSKTPRKRKSAAVKYAHAANSPRKTRSSVFYTSMVAEAIKQSEIEAEKSEEKKQTETKDSPPPNKKAPKSVSRQMPKSTDKDDKSSKEAKKQKRESKLSKSKSETKLETSKKPQKEPKSDKNPDSNTFRTFGELNTILKNETTVDLAKKLIGVNLCRRIDGMKIIGKIVETEAFLGSADQCAITYKKKKSKVLQSYFEGAGSCCVEFLDAGGRQIAISSALPGEYVVIRALQPMLGREKMKQLRGLKNKMTDKDLAKGPTECCQALKVGLDHDCLDLLEGGGDLWIEPGVKCTQIVRTRRELDMHDEKNWNQWSFKRYRFYDIKSNCVTSRDSKEDHHTVNQSDPEPDDQ